MASGRMMSLVFGCLIAVAAVLQCAEAQTTHTVGGNTGWVIPSTSTLYSNWAQAQQFSVGDTLLFNFPSGAHTVAEVNKAAYDACNTEASPIGSVLSSSPARVALNSAGNHYYICTVGQHCVGGQKLAVNVRASGGAGAPTPTPTASPPTTTATPPTTMATPPTSTVDTPPQAMTPPTAGEPGSSATPPAPSSAPSLAVVGFSSVTLLSVAVAFLL